jgi:uncharacterized protein (TIGR00369 family)
VGAPGEPGATGLTDLQRSAAGERPGAPMARLMAISLVAASDGCVVLEGTPEEFHYNLAGAVHGGFAATLLDTAMGCAVYSTLEAGAGCPTIELKVNYLKAITTGTGVVRCTGTVLHRGRTVSMAQGRLENAAGVLMAHATTSCLIVRPGAAC